MESASHQDIEAEIRRRNVAGDLEGAATLGLQHYGPELLGFMAAASRRSVDVDEAFSAFCEALWRALPGFRWHSSFRTWAYAIARHTILQTQRRQQVSARRIAVGVRFEAVAEAVRTTTAPHLRTSVKDDLSRLRAQLDDDEQALLILRIDRQLAWREIAQIMSEPGDEAADEATRRRRAAALRKRFERLKERLGALLRADRSQPG